MRSAEIGNEPAGWRSPGRSTAVPVNDKPLEPAEAELNVPTRTKTSSAMENVLIGLEAMEDLDSSEEREPVSQADIMRKR